LNIFDALNIFYREDTISDFLVTCFRDSNVFLAEFLKAADIQVREDTIFQIDTRVALGKEIGTPDIVIRGIVEDKMKLIIIENKMGAAEGNEQTNRYESSKAKAKIAEKYKVPIEQIHFHFIFLALDTTAKPRNTKFSFINYIIFLENDWPLHQETVQLLFKNFIDKLRNYYEPLNTPYEAFEQNSIMDGIQRKICWQTILFNAFSLNKDLNLSWGEATGSGRSNFVFLISKNNWTSSESYLTAGLKQTFNVHFDTYINLLDSNNNIKKDIGIRYESLPYKPHTEIDQLPDYQIFMENKRIFGDRLFQVTKKKGISTKRRNSKLLVMTLEIKGSTISEKVQNILNQFIAIESCIDEVVTEMKEEHLIR
jgi:hypothetical protein